MNPSSEPLHHSPCGCTVEAQPTPTDLTSHNQRANTASSPPQSNNIQASRPHPSASLERYLSVHTRLRPLSTRAGAIDHLDTLPPTPLYILPTPLRLSACKRAQHPALHARHAPSCTRMHAARRQASPAQINAIVSADLKAQMVLSQGHPPLQPQHAKVPDSHSPLRLYLSAPLHPPSTSTSQYPPDTIYT